MFFSLSKILFYLIMPITWILVLLVYGLLTRYRNRSRLSLWLALATFLIFSNSFLVNEAWLLWEKKPVPVEELGSYDAGIILAGFTSGDKSPRDRVYTNKGADRFLHTVLLYKTGHIKKVIVSGGLAQKKKKRPSEAEQVKALLLLAGVPKADILLEDKSRNTFENAQLTRQVLRQHPELKSFVLVTSGFHMRRASACFKRAGVKHISFPADFYSRDRAFGLQQLFPSEEALALWGRLLHEVFGFLVYKALGYC